MDEAGLFEAMHTQRGVVRYRPDPVPKEAIQKIIEAATMAPSGGNTQPWEFLVITDQLLLADVARLYRELWLGRFGAQAPPDESPGYRSGRYLANHLHEVPAMVLVCVDHSRVGVPYNAGQPMVRGLYASYIWPAVQNLMLAARALGLGTRLTTILTARERELKALLGMPDHVETVALIPLGYPRGRFGLLDRRPASEVTSYNRWGSRG